MKAVIFIHIYYTDLWKQIIEKISKLNLVDYKYYINVSESINTESVVKEIKEIIPKAVVVNSPNKGKDIGGKFVLLNYYLNDSFEADYMLFLHDKKSPQAINGNEWREKLYKIINKDYFDNIIELFKNDKTGIVASEEAIVKDTDENNDIIFAPGKEKLLELKKQYAIKVEDLSFAGGTMFWIRSVIFENFFKTYDIMEIYKSFETGNVLDDIESSNTHCWERLLSWIATNENYKIRGI